MTSVKECVGKFFEDENFINYMNGDAIVYTNVGNDRRNYNISVLKLDENEILININIDGLISMGGRVISSFEEFKEFFDRRVGKYFIVEKIDYSR